MKINPRLTFAGFFAACLYSLGALSASAQRPPGVASLGEMPCQGVQGGGGYRAINDDVVIGLEVFRSVARLSEGGGVYDYIDEDVATRVACRIASHNETPRYRTLSLAFGIADGNEYASNGEVTRLSIYLNGNFYGYRDVVKGNQLLWSVNVTNVRSVALEARCLRNEPCGGIFFVEDILE